MLQSFYKIIHRFTVPGRLPGFNEYQNANRGNKYNAAKIKKETEDYILWFIGDFKTDKPIMVGFKWYEQKGKRQRDIDNIAFAKKFILDAMQKKGTIVNDNYKYVKGFSDEFNFGEESGVEVTLYEVPDEA